MAQRKKPTPLAQALKNVHVILQQEISKHEKENVTSQSNALRTPKPTKPGHVSPDDVTYLTQDAVEKSINFPTWPLNNVSSI